MKSETSGKSTHVEAPDRPHFFKCLTCRRGSHNCMKIYHNHSHPAVIEYNTKLLPNWRTENS